MDFEDILKQVDGYGKYQKYLTVFFLIPVSFVLSWIMIDGLFIVSVPEHWCYVEVVANSNLSVSKQRLLVSPQEDPSCSIYSVNYTDYLDKNVTFTNDTKVVPCTNGWQYSKKDYDSTASTKWNLICENRFLPSSILTLQSVGSLTLTPLYGFLADRYGRKRVYLVLSILSSVAGLLSIVVQDFISFAVMRTIYGGAMPTLYTLAFMLLLEIVAPEMRAHMNGIVTFAWTIGLCTLPLIVYLTRSWIKLGLVCYIALACNLFYCRYLPESPCWLISKGKFEEATTVVEQIGKVNGKHQDRDLLFKQLQELGLSIQKKKENEAGNSAYLLFKNTTTRRRFLILSMCWTALFVTYYGPIFNMSNLSGNMFLNFFLLSIVEIPGNILFWILMDRAGRRWSSSIGFIAVGLFCFGPLTGFKHSDIIFSMIGKLISTGLFMVAEQQGNELLPTECRSFGINLGKTIANVVTLLLPFFSDLGAYVKQLPFIIMGCMGLVAGVLASFLPETLNQNLPQTISDAEEFGKDQIFWSWMRRRPRIIHDTASTSKPNSVNCTTDDVEIERL